MLMKMRSKMQNQKGFTLVELMVVVVIIGILVAIAVPVYNNATLKANKSAIEANLRTIDGAIMQYMATTDTIPADTTELQTGLTGNYLQAWPTKPTGCTYSIIGAGTQASPYKAQVGISGISGITNGSYTLPVSW